MNERIKLNVGGTKFETTRATLTSSPTSLLARMFDPDSDLPPAVLSDDGYYFLDACPRVFSVILNWLRYKDVILGKEVDAVEVIPVADYFCLPELSEKLEALKNNNNIADVIRLDVGGTIFKTSRATLCQQPNSKLARMFTPGSETSPPLTEDGAYFIDACPRAAEVVINWLRGRSQGIVQIPDDGDLAYNNLCVCAKSLGISARVFSRFSTSITTIPIRFLFM